MARSDSVKSPPMIFYILVDWLKENKIEAAISTEYEEPHVEIYPRFCGCPIGYLAMVSDTKVLLMEHRISKAHGGIMADVVERFDLHDPNSLQDLVEKIKSHFKQVREAIYGGD